MELVVTAGPDRGKSIGLSGAARSVGRYEENDLFLVDGAASGRHALVRSTSNDTLEITDLSSTNGTWIDGARVDGSCTVPPGAVITIGNNQFSVRGGSPPGGRAPGGHASTANAPPAATGVPNVQSAGPVAGGNVAMSGHTVAGRDLNYHEGFRIRSRMTRTAKRVLRWGIALIILGTVVGFGAIVAFQQWIFQQADEPFGFDSQPDTDQAAIAFAVVGAGGLVSLVGMALVVTSLLMRREQIGEVVPGFAPRSR